MSFSEACFKFISQFFEDILEDNEDYVISPLSLFLISTLLLEGAKKETKSELAKLLFIQTDVVKKGKESLASLKIEKAREDIESAIRSIYISKQVCMNFGIFTQSQISKSFEEFVENNYHGVSKKTKFEEPGRKLINDWVSKETSNLIKEIIPDGVLSSSTHSVLVNTIYLKANWKDNFDPKLTKKGCTFHGFGKNYKVDMMTKTDVKLFFGEHKFYTEEGNKVKILSCSIPFKNRKFNMLFLLPKKSGKMAFKRFEEVVFNVKRKKFILDTICGDQQEGEIQTLEIPKLKVETKFDNFVKYFKKHGCKKPFGPEADFSGITNEEEFVIDKIIHNAVITLDEFGVEAAAASAATVTKGGGDDDPFDFICDRPFLCFLIKLYENTVYFSVRKVKF